MMGRDATRARLCGAAVSLLLTVAGALAAAQEDWDIAHCGKKCAITRAPKLVQLLLLSPAAAAPVRRQARQLHNGNHRVWEPCHHAFTTS